MRVFYLGLEPYRERYTEQLTGWVTRALQRRGIEHVVIEGTRLAGDGIRVGQVLDAHGRSHWALTQMANLIALEDGPTADDWIWIDDLFHPGFEALPYIYDQAGARPRIAVRNHAQSVDPDDFTFPMRHWMREYEQMVDNVADVTFCASTAHKELMQVARLGRNAQVVGLPFDMEAVREQGPAAAIAPWDRRPRWVVYSSRLDSEKQPHFFLDIVEQMWQEASFIVCTGADEPRSNDPTAIKRLLEMERSGQVIVETGLSKAVYYRILSHARVQLNTARQDFVSYTACEASTFGVPTLAPAFRAFPETLENRASQMFVPWSLDDAVAKLRALLKHGEPLCGRVAEYNHGSLDRIVDVLTA